MKEKIDIVIPWVDGSEAQWLEEKNHWYEKLNPDKESNSNIRYQSWDNLFYWFRAVEKFLPWFNKIYFITWGHIPGFLQLDSPRIKVVRHEEFIPQEFLPTFNVNTIEMNLHRISELSENIIYFNDDTFPLVPIEEKYYYREGKVCDEAIETPIIPMFFSEIAKYTWNMRALNISIINKHFKKREVQKANYDKWFFEDYGELLARNQSLSYWDNFVGFRDPHVPTALKKSTFAKVWKAEPEILGRACESKFRDFSSINQWLVRYWQICEGDFVPRRTLGKSYTVTVNNSEEIADIIRAQKQQIICMNEECTAEEFEQIKTKINEAFKELLPDKSSFEK